MIFDALGTLALGEVPSSSVETAFVEIRPVLTAKLRRGVLILPIPALQATSETATVTDTRITEQINTRVTRAGHTRVTRSYTVASSPELVIMKLANGVINIGVANQKPKKKMRQ